MNVISAYMLISSGDATTGGPYTVRFFDDDDELIQTDVDIPQYGTAHCTLLDGTILNGEYFKGWNPSPVSVVRNLDCYPVRGEYIISHEEIHDSWDAICADGGAHYPLGAYKTLVIDMPANDHTFTVTAPNGVQKQYTDHIQANNIAMHMVKVAEGEDGSTSTWLSTGCITIWGSGSYGSYMAQAELTSDGDFPGMKFDWGNIELRKYLNSQYMQYLPQVIQRNIKDVTKAYKGYTNYGYRQYSDQVEKETIDKIWIPSVKELYTYFDGLTFGHSRPYNWSNNLEGIAEFGGIDYSTIYLPTYNYGTGDTCCGTRTSNIGRDNRGNSYAVSVHFWGNSTLDISQDTRTPVYFPIGFCL